MATFIGTSTARCPARAAPGSLRATNPVHMAPARPAPRPSPRIVLMRASKADEKPSEQDRGGSRTPEEVEEVSAGQLPREGRTAPMADDKRSVVEQMGAAPEGDKAVLGQAYQPTGPEAYKETPEQRYGSREAYEEAMEASKDRSRKSEKQTGDEDGSVYAEGGA